MKQTPLHDSHNPDLLALMPKDARTIVEVGCSSGALAREYKKLNPKCRYIGIEVVPEYAELAKRYCDSVMALDIESTSQDFLTTTFNADCWVFGDSLEHLRDPWHLLERIRATIAKESCIVACIPNTQHWTTLLRLCCGDLRYEDSGLWDRSHLRFFTRLTIMDMFKNSGFAIQQGFPRIFNEPAREGFLPAIRAMAEAIGIDPEIAVNDSLALQYVIKAVPI